VRKFDVENVMDLWAAKARVDSKLLGHNFSQSVLRVRSSVGAHNAVSFQLDITTDRLITCIHCVDNFAKC